MGNANLGTQSSNSPISGGAIANTSISDAELASNAVTTAKIAANAVTTAKIAANAVTNDLLASDAVRSTQTLNTQTSSYTLVLSDANFNSVLAINSSGAATVTIPNNSSVAFSTGAIVNLIQLGAGQVTVAGAGGVTVNAESGRLKTRAQYAVLSMLKTDTNSWVVFGNTVG